MSIRLIIGVKGSSKSGNYGHGGRPGKVGGSTPKPVAAPIASKPIVAAVSKEPELLALKDGPPARILDNVNDVKGSKFGKGYFILGDNINSPHKGKIVDISGEFGGGTNDHPGFIAGSTNPELFGMTNKQANAFYRSYLKGDYTPAMQTGWDKIFASGAIRVRQFQGSGVNLDTQKLDTPTMRRLQTLYGENKLDFKPGKDNYWADASGDYIKFNLEDLLNSRTVERLQKLAAQH